MGKAAKTFDNGLVAPGIVQGAVGQGNEFRPRRVGEPFTEGNRQGLVFGPLRMFQGKVEEDLLPFPAPGMVAAGQAGLGQGQGQVVVFEGVALAAENVPGELVERDNGRQPGPGTTAGPVVCQPGCQGCEGRQEPLGNLMVSFGRFAKPEAMLPLCGLGIVARGTDPVIENVQRGYNTHPVRFVTRQAVRVATII